MLYPNPATNEIQINGLQGNDLVPIYNMSGMKVLESQGTNAIDISYLKEGLYIAEFGDKKIKFFKN